MPYVFSVLAHNIDVGPDWQKEATLRDEGITDFMKKVSVLTELDDQGCLRDDVEVVAGSRYNQETYTRRGSAVDLDMDDSGLKEKFLGNCRSFLDEKKARKAVSTIFELEKISDLREVFELISP